MFELAIQAIVPQSAEAVSENLVRIHQSLAADSGLSESYFDFEKLSFSPLTVHGSKPYYADDVKSIKVPHVNIPCYYSSDSKGTFPLVQHS